MRRIAGLCLFALAAPVLASNPGEPLDCSDWMSVEPGYTCTVFVPPGCNANVCSRSASSNLVVDNQNRAVFVRNVILPVACWAPNSIFLVRTEVVVYDGTTETVVAAIHDRCNGPSLLDRLIYNQFSLLFDAQRGALLFKTTEACNRDTNSMESCPYPGQNSMIAIEGFATTFEILQTFTPTADAFSFDVPYMPEGMQFADFFDTYTGNLATVGDWSQLQPLQCGYPATAPSVGDYLTVADTLPTPAPGTGRYYLTVANFMGERRFGRKNIGGVLSGRDPAALPACP